MAQLNVKKVIARLLRWVQYPTVKRSTANTDSFFTAQRTDTGTTVSFGVGSVGVNHGVYSNKLGKWLIYGDASTVYVDNIPMSRATGQATKSGNYYSSGIIYFCRMNGVVSISFHGIALGTISARTVIATIPAGFRPPYDMTVSSTQYTTLGCFVSANGNISVEPAMSGKTLWASLTYVAWN